ncbi:MAG: ABC transporter permease subunit [Clostridiales bacterium]|jgi:putative aldouronate transport system permease protein|nr:ABC transporter permease subunit [Clostridiales bacterium]
MSGSAARLGSKDRLTFSKSWERYKYIYLLLLPGVIYLIIFKYLPMYGLIIAFQEFTIFSGVFQSAWAGLENFSRMMSSRMFWQAFWNTIRISVLRLIFVFPAPVLFSLLLNELPFKRFRRFTQTISYLPHFISWIIIAGILDVFVNPGNGVIMLAIQKIGLAPPNVISSNTWFVPMLIVTDIYKTMGYSAIVYLAAISSIDPGLYEAAIIDGASRFRLVWHITLPSILPVICIMFIFNIGSIMEGGFNQIFVLYNPLVYRTADIIDTFIYRMGILTADYSLGAAAQFFKSIIGMLLVIGSNYGVRLFKQSGLW